MEIEERTVAQKRKKEILGIIMIMLGILLALSLIFKEQGLFMEYIELFFSTFLGQGIIGVPLFFLLWGFLLIRERRVDLNTRLTGILLILAGLLTSLHLTVPAGEEFLWALERRGGGGMIGALILRTLRFGFSDTGIIVLLLGVLLIGILLLTNLSLLSILERARIILTRFTTKPLFTGLKRRRERKREKRLEREREKEREAEEDYRKEDSFKEDDSEEDLPLLLFPEKSEGRKTDRGEEKEEKEGERGKEGKERKEGKVGNDEELVIDEESQRKREGEYRFPSMKLLKAGTKKKESKTRDLSHHLEDTLESFGVEATVQRITHGPTISRYELQPARGIKVSKITNLANDIALAFAVSDVRIESPIPGKSLIGIEVPHHEENLVTLKDILNTPAYKKSKDPLLIGLGLSISGDPVFASLGKMPHLLIAGATGSGKSVCMNSIISSILFKASPHEVKLILIDPKKVELSSYEGLPHLMAPVVVDLKQASSVLTYAVEMMEERYERFARVGARDITSYNHISSMDKDEEFMPFIVVIIDELADMMMVAPDVVENSICRLAQMARAAGIHLVIATQRPSVDVITGLIKANIPSRIAFAVSSQIDSRTILDMGGAEKLLGKGDMLFYPVGGSKPLRVQGAFISDKEIQRVVQSVCQGQDAEYEIQLEDLESDDEVQLEDKERDPLYQQAVEIVVETQASISMLQRRLRIGYTRAARLIDSMEKEGIVGPYIGSKPRKILISAEEVESIFAKDQVEEDKEDLEKRDEREESEEREKREKREDREEGGVKEAEVEKDK